MLPLNPITVFVPIDCHKKPAIGYAPFQIHPNEDTEHGSHRPFHHNLRYPENTTSAQTITMYLGSDILYLIYDIYMIIYIYDIYIWYIYIWYINIYDIYGIYIYYIWYIFYIYDIYIWYISYIWSIWYIYDIYIYVYDTYDIYMIYVIYIYDICDIYIYDIYIYTFIGVSQYPWKNMVCWNPVGPSSNHCRGREEQLAIDKGSVSLQVIPVVTGLRHSFRIPGVYTLWLCQNSYWKWPSRNSGFTHWKWWFSIAM